MFSTDGRGFGMKFANGWSVSVRWSSFHYCDARDNPRRLADPIADCANAECAVINPVGDLVYWPTWDDQVRGWLSPDAVLQLMSDVAVLAPDHVLPTERTYEEEEA